MKGGFVVGDNAKVEDPLAKVYKEAADSSLKKETDNAKKTILESDMKASFEVHENHPEMHSVVSEGASSLETDIPDYQPEETKFFSSPVFWFLLLFSAWAALETWNQIHAAFMVSNLAGIVWAAVVSILFIASVVSIWREMHTVLMLQSVDTFRNQVLDISENGSFQDAVQLTKKLAKNSHIFNSSIYSSFLKKISPHHDPETVFMLYGNTVLGNQDKKAQQVIVHRAAETGVVVALSPLAWLDMLLTFARSMRMVREIAEVYGLRPGVWGRMQLYRRVMKNLIFIGVADLAADAVVDSFGASATAKISKVLGVGISAAVLTSRLGYVAVKSVRPLPIDRSVMSLGKLRKEILLNGEMGRLIKSIPN